MLLSVDNAGIGPVTHTPTVRNPRAFRHSLGLHCVPGQQTPQKDKPLPLK